MMNLGSGAGLAGLRKMECTPHRAGKALCITVSPKNRDMIIHYNTSAFWPSVKQKSFTIQYDTSFYVLLSS